MEQRDAPSSCPACGLVVPGAEGGCHALYEELRALMADIPEYQQRMRVVHDTYCVQHEERYCGRAKGLAAHLGGLCWAVEYSGHATGYRALGLLLDRLAWDTVPYPPPPGIPAFRGAVTAADALLVVRTVPDPDQFGLVVEQWARSAWDAYAPLHPWARSVVEQALHIR